MKKKLAIIIPMVIIAAVFISFGTMAGNTKKYDGKIFKGVYVKDIDLGGLTKEEAIKAIENEYNDDLKSKSIRIIHEDFQHKISYRRLKAHYKVEEAVNVAYDYCNTDNLLKRTMKRINLKNNKRKIDLKFAADMSIIEKDVNKIARKLDQDPKDAKISYNGSFNITDDEDGVKVDKPKLTELINKAVNPIKKEEIVEIPLNIVHAKIRADMLSSINTKISSFSTAFKLIDPNRVGNIRIASEKIDGTVVLPGDVFSMNKTLGPRVAAKGYKEAHVIINGTLANGLAGGICQVSSTVYNAALLANFPIVERRAHGLKVGYVEAGRDATISGDSIDFRFKNSNSTPIYIQAYVRGGTLTVNVFGMNENPGQSVVITSEITERVDAKVETIKDSKLPSGQRIVESKPISGIKSVTYRKVYQNGRLIKNELLSKDYYKPSKGVIRVGAAKVLDKQTSSPIQEQGTKQKQ